MLPTPSVRRAQGVRLALGALYRGSNRWDMRPEVWTGVTKALSGFGPGSGWKTTPCTHRRPRARARCPRLARRSSQCWVEREGARGSQRPPSPPRHRLYRRLRRRCLSLHFICEGQTHVYVAGGCASVRARRRPRPPSQRSRPRTRESLEMSENLCRPAQSDATELDVVVLGGSGSRCSP